MIFTLDIWSVLIVVCFAQGVFLLVQIFSSGLWRRPQVIFLSGLVIAFLWLLAEFYSVRYPYNVGFNLFYGTRYGSWMLPGPLYYLYLRSMLLPQKRVSLRDSLHFVPFILFTLILPLWSDGLLSFFQVHYGMLTPFYPYDQEITPLNALYSGVFIFQFMHLSLYIAAGVYLINSYSKGILQRNSNISGSIHWLRILNYALLLAVICVTTFLAIFFFTRVYRRHLDYLYVIPMAIIVYAIAFRLLKVQFPDVELHSYGHSKKYERSTLTKELAVAYSEKLRLLLEEEQAFLQSDLRLGDLASSMGISSHQLSQVINEEMGTTFFDLINKYRVKEAQKLIREEPESSLLQIAYKAGFNNKTSFVNAFKKHTGATPSGFRGKRNGL